MYDGRTRLSSQVAEEVRDALPASGRSRPAYPRSVRISEAPEPRPDRDDLRPRLQRCAVLPRGGSRARRARCSAGRRQRSRRSASEREATRPRPGTGSAHPQRDHPETRPVGERPVDVFFPEHEDDGSSRAEGGRDVATGLIGTPHGRTPLIGGPPAQSRSGGVPTSPQNPSGPSARSGEGATPGARTEWSGIPVTGAAVAGVPVTDTRVAGQPVTDTPVTDTPVAGPDAPGDGHTGDGHTGADGHIRHGRTAVRRLFPRSVGGTGGDGFTPDGVDRW